MNITIIGTSVAGTKAAQALRAQGYDGEITIFGSETGPIYDKPALSKEFLRGEIEVDGNLLLDDDEVRELGLDLRQGRRAVCLDTDSRTVTLSDGGTWRHDTLIIAPRARSRTP